MKSLKVPILFLVFNRPEETRQVFNSIKKVKPKKLFIAADGARKGNKSDKKNIKKVRKIISQINWKCEVKTLYRKDNLGCKLAVSGAIDWFFENVKEGIILEDDCLPTTDFFYFCEKLLSKYRNNPKVMMISGTNYLGNKFVSNYDYIFSQYHSVWGWATWKRAWDKYDINMSKWPINKNTVFPYTNKMAKKYLSSMFSVVKKGRLDTWDAQWFYTCLTSKGVSIVPRVNMISNIGIKGAHTNKSQEHNNRPVYPLNTKKLSGPKQVHVDVTYDENLFEMLFPNLDVKKIPSFLQTLYHKLKLLTHRGVLKNVNNNHYRKHALVRYLTLPFTNSHVRSGFSHQSHQQVIQIARILGLLRYNVDVVDYNKKASLSKTYDLIFDIHPIDNPIYEKNINKKTKLIAYLTGTNPTFSNQQEMLRLARISNDMGIELQPRRQVQAISEKIKDFDAVLLFGNSFTLSTFQKEFNMPKVYYIPNTFQTTLPIDLSLKNKNTFMFLGGKGQVHKGLDLVLESFARLPQYTLHVCSPYEKEKDFINTYRKYLKKYTNIIAHEYIDIKSAKFARLASQAGYCIFPSCSEAMPGSVMTCMAAGMIPIVTREIGLDYDDQIIIPTPTTSSITSVIRKATSISEKEFLTQAKKAMTYAKDKYSIDNYIHSLYQALIKIISNKI